MPKKSTSGVQTANTNLNAKSKDSAPKPALTQKQLLFPGYTGKTPITLLNEFCQKRSWLRPDIQALQHGKTYSAIVYMKRTNPKDAGKVDTVVYKAPNDSDISIARDSAAEARHFGAVYALFRFANGLNLRNVLPPICRDYFVALEKHKAETIKTKAFLWEADPFKAAEAQAVPPTPSSSNISKKPLSNNRTAIRLSSSALKEVEDYLKVNMSILSDSGTSEGFTDSEQDIEVARRHLLSLKFNAADVDEALIDVVKLRSEGHLNFVHSDLKTSLLDYLLLALPNAALPASFRDKKIEMKIQAVAHNSSEALSQSWLAQKIHTDTGFPLDVVTESLSAAGGREGLCLDILMKSATTKEKQDLNDIAESLRTMKDATDRTVVLQHRQDEILALQSIYPDRVQILDDILRFTFESFAAQMVIYLHQDSAYPSSGALPTVQIRTKAAAYINVYLSIQAYEFIQNNLGDLLQAGEGGIISELIPYLEESIPKTIAKPPKIVESIRFVSHRAAIKKNIPQAGITIPISGSRRSRTDQSKESQQWARLKETSTYQDMLRRRQQLPAWSSKDEIVEMVRSSQCSLINGETGSGKSTQVPAFILDDAISRQEDCSIIVTQPRRISAIGVAQRVAQECASEIGSSDSLVGYQIRGEKRAGPNCKLLFATTGILLRMLRSDDFGHQGVTHIMIDEVHERSLEIDILLLELKMLIESGCKFKIILMSATMDPVTSAYFDEPPSLTIAGRTYPIEDFYLEDLIENTAWQSPSLKASRSYTEEEKYRMSSTLQDKSPETVATVGMLARSERVPPELVATAVEYALSQTNARDVGSILVFTSGVAEIDAIMKAIRSKAVASQLDLIPLHATLSSADQQKIFRGHRKINCVISTNVAETSITIPDCTIVIDTGKVKEVRMADGMSTLLETWISRASVKQRRGRAGRVRPGTCYKLFSKWTEDRLLPHTEPEITRVPLENLLLSIKAAHSSIDAASYLSRMISPPALSNLKQAEETCLYLGLITPETSAINRLGQLVSLLPLDIRLGKLLVLGSIFDCLPQVLSLAAILTAKPLLKATKESFQDVEGTKQRFLHAESDVLTDLAILKEAKSLRGRELRAFIEDVHLSFSALEEILLLERDYSTAMKAAGMSQKWESSSSTAADPNLLKTLLFASSMHTARVKLPDATFTSTVSGAVQDPTEAREIKFFSGERVFLHPSSVLFGASSFSTQFLTYTTQQITTKTFIRSCSTLPIHGMLLFSNAVEALPNGLKIRTAQIEWRVDAFPKLIVIIKGLKRIFDYQLADIFDGTRENIDSDLVRIVTILLHEKG